MEGSGANRLAQPGGNCLRRRGGRSPVVRMPLGLFAFLAALAVIASLGVILQRNPIHCLLALALTLVDLGALYIGLGAETVGLLQIIIYVGAIMVLFLFVIWLLNLQTEPTIG